MLSPLPSVTSLQQAGHAFRRFFDELRGAFFERDALFTQLELALLSREHVLLMGPPGTGKSALAQAVLGRIVDERTGAPSLFSRQLTESTVQTDLIGPVNFKVLTETGRTEYLTDEGILGATHAFLDEVFDGRDMLLRSILNALEEREMKGGPRLSAGQLGTAVLTSNRYLSEVVARSPELLVAFADRLAFTAFVPRAFARSQSRAALVARASSRQRPHLSARLTLQELAALQTAVSRVEVPAEVLHGVEVLAQAMEETLIKEMPRVPGYLPTRHFSARTLVKAVWALKAVVVQDSLGESLRDARIEDLGALRAFFTLNGPRGGDLEVLLKTTAEAGERQQLEALLLESRAFDEALANAAKRVRQGTDEERTELRAHEDFAAAEALARSFEPNLAATLARALVEKLVPGPRHAQNRLAVLAAARTLSSAALARAARGMAWQGEGRAGRVLWTAFVEVLRLVMATPELVPLLDEMRKALLALGDQALEVLVLSADAVAFDGEVGMEALAGVCRQIELELQEINRVWTALLSNQSSALDACRRREQLARGRVVASIRRRAEAIFAESGPSRLRVGSVGGESRRLRSLEEALSRLHPDGKGLTERLLGPVARTYADEMLATSPFSRVDQYFQAVQLAVETLRREGLAARDALEQGHDVMAGRLREYVSGLMAQVSLPAVQPTGVLNGEAYFLYRERFGPSGPEGELGALQRLGRLLADEGVTRALPADLSRSLGEAELRFHQGRLAYLRAWVGGLRQMLAPEALKTGTSLFDVLVRSRLPLLVLREGELVRLRGALVGLEAEALVVQVDAIEAEFRALAEQALSAPKA